MRMLQGFPVLETTFLLALAVSCGSAPSPTASTPMDNASSGGVVGRLDIVKGFAMPELGTTRTLRIWLPPGYDESGRRHPVLYLHDGQNLFDAATSFAGEWKVDESLSALAAGAGSPGDWIVVGMDNGGGERLNEYSPFADRLSPAPRGDRHVEFIVSTLKPWVDASYRTLPDRGHTAIGGSSMGGLISLYAAWKHPELFSRVLCLSSAFWPGGDALLELVRSRGIAGNLRVYLDVGGMEGGNAGERLRMVDGSRNMRAALVTAGIPASAVRLIIDPRASHNEVAWAARFPAAWEWIVGEAPAE